MKQILFPTAYSSLSQNAYRYAQKLAQYFEASITLVHIYDFPAPPMATFEASLMAGKTPQLSQLAENKWQEQVQKLKAFAKEMDAKQFKNIPLDFIATDGIVIEELMAIQRENQFDLVVMGMRRQNLGERLFGSTAYEMIDKISCPVLLIPPDTHFMGVDKLIYGTAFEAGDKSAIELLLQWCTAFDATLRVLHVSQKAGLTEARQKMEELMTEFKREKIAGIIDFQLLEGETSTVLQEYTNLTSADILAIHRRKQGFWQRITEGSLTRTLATEVKVPLLVFK